MSTTRGAVTMPLDVRAREDLMLQLRNGFTMVKDPIAATYFQLSEEEEWVLRRLGTGAVSLANLKTELETEFFPKVTSHRQLNHVIGVLAQRGLVSARAGGDADAIYRRGTTQRRQRLATHFNPLFIRLPGFDPTAALSLIYPLFRPFLKVEFFLLWAMWLLSVAMFMLANVDQWSTQLPDWSSLLQWHQLPWLLVAIAIAKVCHELGHAVACKHFGGECHEIGVALFLGTPCLYCDTTDAWMLPSRWRRLVVAAAGVSAEITLSAIAALVWYFCRDAELRQQCLYLVLACSISTLVFNLNPLLRYDGYYALSDFLGIANLWSRSRAYLVTCLSSQCTGLRLPIEPSLSVGTRVFFLAYAALSITYRWIVLGAALWIVSQLLEPIRMGWVFWPVLMVFLALGVRQSLYPSYRYFKSPRRRALIRKGRAVLLLTFSVAAATVVLSVPLPDKVRCAGQLRLVDQSYVFVESDGVLAGVFVEYGEHVKAGQPLARLSNARVELEIIRGEERLALQQDRLVGLQRLRAVDSQAASRIPSLQAVIAQSQQALDVLRRQAASLLLTAPCDGVVLRPQVSNPQRKLAGPGDFLQEHLLATNRGHHWRLGQPVCRIKESASLEVVALVPQAEIEQIAVGLSASVRIPAAQQAVAWGQVVEIATAASRDNHSGQSNLGLEFDRPSGDDAAGRSVERFNSASQPTGLGKPFEVKVALPALSQPCLDGMTAVVHIHTARRSLAQRMYKRVNDVFQIN